MHRIQSFLRLSRSESEIHSVCRHVSSSIALCRKAPIDKSNVPILNENDLEEKFVKGWGPGGQSVNKTNSACFLRHVPTGVIVKCHEHRALESNRKQARIYLVEKLDEMINGENSMKNQKAKINDKKSKKRDMKTDKRRILKENWKNSQGVSSSDQGSSEDGHEYTKPPT